MRDERTFRAAGNAINARLVELGLTQDEVAHRSHVSTSTIRKLLKGRPGGYQPFKLAQLSRALGWPPDGIARLLDGARPDELPTTAVPPADARLLAGVSPHLAGKIAQLPPADLLYLEDLVDRFLRQQPA
jgi:transcriptional regulator with XRE-family HTH domain